MKRLLAIIMTATLLFSAAACGGSNSGSTPSSSAATSGGDSNSGDAATEAFVIGGLGPLTGAAASYGISVKQGAEVAVKEINDAGGVTAGDITYTFEMNFQDDEHSEDKVITAYNTLMDSGIDVLMGAVTSGPTIAVSSLSHEDGVLMITPSGSAIQCTQYDNAFRICFTDPLQGVTMANFAKDELGLSKVAVIYNNSDEYSSGMKDAFVEQANDIGLEVVANEAFTEGDVDFSTQLTTINNTDAEAIFCPVYYEAASYITKQASDRGMSLQFLGCDGWDGVLGQVTDATPLEGSIILSPFLAADPAAKDFVTAYEAAYGSTPDQFAADGYDAIYTIKAALEQAGTKDKAALIAAMTEIEVVGTTGTFTFTAEGEPDKQAKYIIIKDGEYTAY